MTPLPPKRRGLSADFVLVVICLLLAVGAFADGKIAYTCAFLYGAHLFVLLTLVRWYADWYYTEGPGKLPPYPGEEDPDP